MNAFTKSLSLTLSFLLVLPTLQAQDVTSDLRIQVVEQASDSLSVSITDASGAPVSDTAVVVRMPEEGASGVFADGSRSMVSYTSGSGKVDVKGIRWNSEAGSCSVRITATRGNSHAGVLWEHSAGPGEHTAAPVAVTQAAAARPSVPPVVPPQPGELKRPEVTAAPPAAPKISVVNAPTHEKIHGGSNKKWLILALVAAGAGAGIAMAGGGKGSGSASPAPSTGVSIGNPTVTIGK